MASNLSEKLKESLVSVLPVMGIVVGLHFTIAPLPDAQLPQFLVGGLLLILGLSIFLLGADLGMVPFGQKVGSALTRKRSLPLIMAASFAIGFAITIAEPDVQVLANQVANVAPAIDKSLLLSMIAVGVGLFLLIGTARIVMQVPLRRLLIIFYALLFLACAFVEPSFVGVAFDSGGATTGPITVPFIMAMGIGVASTIAKKEGDDSSFGLVGLASIGPIAAVAAMGFFTGTGLEAGEGQAAAAQEPLPLLDHFLAILPHIVQEITLALLPLFVIFLVFQFLLLKLPFQQVKRMVLGMIYAWLGLIIFMAGVNGGFSPAGQSLGMALGSIGSGWVLLPIGFALGAVVVCAEPAVWVLNEQVEELSGGHIPRRIMLAALSVSIALAVVLGMIRVLTGISIWVIVLPGYLLALALTFFCPRLFTAIAFDSGGVASGPMATTFVLSLTLGASLAVGGNPVMDAFGMIAMIAMAPLITIQLLGIVFKALEQRQTRKAKKLEAKP
ncbi:DUF1538 domain-containing protein [Desulfovibrio sp. OttesenSCG-928-G11]|nr:DUF1538 domain-containing protein [Desulfovibrio sp. OttesenSCG-928-G11]